MDLLQPYMNWIYIGSGALALLIFAWLALRTFGGRVRAKRGSRLGISEYYEVDKSRFLVLVRRDDVEHLVLVGGSQDVVIETGITARSSRKNAVPGAKRSRNLTAEGGEHIPAAPAPRQVTDGPAFAGNDPAGNVAPLATRPVQRPAGFPEPVSAVRPPNLRAVEHDLDK